jgi:hypothetical protein
MNVTTITDANVNYHFIYLTGPIVENAL